MRRLPLLPPGCGRPSASATTRRLLAAGVATLLLVSTAVVAVASSPVADDGVVLADDPAYLFSVGRMLATEGRIRDAIATLTSAVAGAPEDPYLRVELALALARAGQLDAAGEQLEHAGQLAPDDLDVLRGSAQVELFAADRDPRRMAQAMATLQRLRQETPNDLRNMLALAQLHLAQGQAGPAAEVLRELARYWPAHPVVASMLVDALLQSGATTEAEEALRRLLEAHPGALDARLQLADLESRRGDHRAARATLESAPEEQVATPEVLRRLAFEQFRSGDLARALASTDRLLASDPTSLAGRYLRGIALAALGRDAEAEALLSELARETPRSGDVIEALASVLERMGEVDRAAVALADLAERLPADDGQRARIGFRRALLLARHQRGEEAVEALAPALASTDGELADQALMLLVRVLGDLGRQEEALGRLADRAAHGPLPPPLAARRAELLLAGGRGEEGERLLAEMGASGDPETVLAAAEVFQRRGEAGRAVPLLRAQLERTPDVVPLRYALGSMLERSGQHAAAASAFQELLLADPDFAPALNYLGYMWAERGENLDEAERLTTRAVALDPNNGAYVDSLGWALFQHGKLEAAREQLEKAAALLPDDPTIAEHLGDVYRALGDRERARSQYERALALPGVEPSVRQKLAELAAP